MRVVFAFCVGYWTVWDTMFLESEAVIVTGASKGIGRSIVQSFLEHTQVGHVYAISRTVDDLNCLSASHLQQPRITAIKCDVSDTSKLREAIRSCFTTAQESGAVPTMLVNNAGVALTGPFSFTHAADIDLAFDVTMNTNVKAAMAGIHEFHNCALTASRRDCNFRIVNISSQASSVALPNHTNYCMSKAAMDMLTQCMALELNNIPQGPRFTCNSVNPTVVLTDMGKKNWDPATDTAKRMMAQIPLNRFANVDDVVNCVLFLLSSQASMINGVSIPIDGGFLAARTLA